MSRPEVVVVPDGAALTDEAARRVEQAVLGAAESPPARLALAGGSTPIPLYRHLASRPLPWARMELFFTDERCVPADDPRSNYRMVKEALLDRVPIPPAAVHRIPGELAPAKAASRAEEDLRHSFGDIDPPEIDLIVLGMGSDGHTASLFPSDDALGADGPLALAIEREGLDAPHRVTLTLPVINAARARLVMVSGADKSEALAQALAGTGDLPAGRLAHADTVWLVTADAAQSLDQS